jgi:Arc/MetJ-type ribon-helix-helix transcriptional regulator
VKIIKATEIRRNITLSLPRSLISKAKLEAVKQDKSLSEFIREALEEKLDAGSAYQKAKQRQLEKLAEGLDLGTCGRISVSREELHERR